LKKTDSWQQAAFVEKGGWAVMPGSKAADSGVSRACAGILSAAKWGYERCVQHHGRRSA
jgi:hypothetical protein